MTLFPRFQDTVIKRGVHSSWMLATVRHLSPNFVILALSHRLFLTVSQHFTRRRHAVLNLPTWVTTAVCTSPISTALTQRVQLVQITNNIHLKYTLLTLSVLPVPSELSPYRVSFSVVVILTLAAHQA
jgi:hypothetical protein